MDECVFCAIIAGTHEKTLLYEDDEFVAFLDNRPVFRGHTLVVPKQHIASFDDLPIEKIQPLFALAQKIMRAAEKGLPADGALVLLNNKVSQSVPHVHVHVIPRKFKFSLRGFLWPRKKLSAIEAIDIQKKIKQYL